MTVSNCCGAGIINEHRGEGICQMCHEHCAVDKEDDSSWLVWFDSSGELQDKFNSMMSTADRIITRGKQIKELETK